MQKDALKILDGFSSTRYYILLFRSYYICLIPGDAVCQIAGGPAECGAAEEADRISDPAGGGGEL